MCYFSGKWTHRCNEIHREVGVFKWSKKPRSGTWVHPHEKFTLELSARTSFASSGGTGDMFSPFAVDFLYMTS